MGFCQGTLRQVADTQLTEGFSRKFARSMFGLTSVPAGGLSIGLTYEDFDEWAPEFLEGQTISGVQRKALMKLEGSRIVPAREHGIFILKPSPPEIPHLAENEHAMMNLARAAGLSVAECTVLPFEDGELGYITKRFDIQPDGSRHFIEDAASLCRSHPANKGDHDMWSYELAIQTMFEAAGRKQVLLLKGLQQVLFAYLTGNNDLHLKNFSLYRKAGSTSVTMFDFTPMYDVISVYPYPEYNQIDSLTLSLTEAERDGVFSEAYENYGYYTRADFVALGCKLGLRERAVNAYVTALTDKVEKHLKPVVEASYMPAKMKKIIIESTQRRIRYMRR